MSKTIPENARVRELLPTLNFSKSASGPSVRRLTADAGGMLERLADNAIGEVRVALGEVRVALGRARLAMPRHLADDRQRHAAHQCIAGERVPEVMKADIGDAHGLADVLPRQV